MHNTYVLVFTGPPTAGKTEAMNWAKFHISSPTIIYSMVDKAKEIAIENKWWDESDKTPKSRSFLFELKNLLDKYYDASFETLKETIRLKRDDLDCLGYENTDIYVLVCSKEAKDIERLRKEYNASVILIEDDGIRSNFKKSNQADAQDFEKELLKRKIPMYIIKNIDTLDRFYYDLSDLMISMGVPINDKRRFTTNNGNMATRIY